MPPLGIAADIVLIVLAGLLGGFVAHRLRQPLLVGYILAGVLVGPHTMGPTVRAVHDIELLAEIGVALLLFATGIEVSFGDLRPVRKVALIGGPILILATMGFGYALASRVLGFGGIEPAWFGAAVSMSSTMVVLKTLAARGVMATLASRLTIGLTIIQDLAVAPMLIILPRLRAGGGIVAGLLPSMLQAAVFLSLMIFAGTRVIPAILKRIVKLESRELFLVTVLALGTGVGYGTHHFFGLSFAFGAFAAGLAISESQFSHQALSDLIPLRDLFGLLFFASVGMLFDPRYLFANFAQVMGVVLLVTAGKILISGVIARAYGYGNMAPWIAGFGLCNIGEFAFVLARAGLREGSISNEMYSLVLASTVVTMLISPLLLNAVPAIYRQWRRLRPQERPLMTFDLPAQPLEGHVIVAGCGSAGRAVLGVLRENGIPCVAVELNYALADNLSQAGYPVVWGDCTSEEVLRAASAGQALALVATLPSRHTARLTLQRARRLNPRLEVVSRATSAAHLAELRAMGVEQVVQTEYEGGLQIVRQVLAHYGRTDSEIRSIIVQAREAVYRQAAG
jgi:CPA2 family monovalent cation:H+ antiporter-2